MYLSQIKNAVIIKAVAQYRATKCDVITLIEEPAILLLAPSHLFLHSIVVTFKINFHHMFRIITIFGIQFLIDPVILYMISEC